MSSFPLPTLAPTITAAGVAAPSYSDILNSLTASYQGIFGSDAFLGPNTQDGQLLSVFALAVSDMCQRIVDTYNNFIPAFAQGAALSALVQINGLQRQVSTNSTAILTLVGVAGTVIFNGIAQDTSGNNWLLPGTVLIPGGGSVNVTATAQQTGAIAAGANTITVIATPTLGWQSVTNSAAAAPGAPVETDAALRIRQAISTGLPAQTTLQAIAAAVANLSGVTRSVVYENSTSSVDANGAAAHSIYAVVQGGSLQAIAQVIEAKKSPGTGTVGTTTITVTDPSGLPVPINFYVLTLTSIFVSVTIKAGSNFVSATGTALVAALVAAINALPIGSPVFYSYLIAVAGMPGTAQGLTYHVTVGGLTVGTSPSPSGTTDVSIAFNAAASTQTANIILTVT